MAKATDLTKGKADLLGVKYSPNISEEKLVEKIREKTKENNPEPNVVAEKAPKGDVKRTEEEIISDTIVYQRKTLLKKRRVIISCNDPQMKDYENTPYYSVRNSIINLPKVTAPLNVEWTIPQVYYDFLKDMECTVPVKRKDEKGRPITVPKLIKRYNIQDLPDFTEEEYEELQTAQAAREGVAKAK